MTEPAQIVREDLNGVVVLSPIGEFDLASAEDLRTSLGEAINDTTKVVVDLSGTTFLDSTGLGVIMVAARRCQELGGWTRVVGPRPNVRRVLRVTQVDTVLGLYDTVEEAVAHDAPSA